MTGKAVVFVGLEEDRILEFELDESVSVSVAESVPEAVAMLSLCSPDLIISNHIIGGLDSLDFIAEILETSPDTMAPVVFLAPPDAGIQPFIYERLVSGFEVAFLDSQGRAQTTFIEEESNKRDYSVRSLLEGRIIHEVTQILSGLRHAPQGPLTREEFEALAWELGMNQELEIQGTSFHIQTEIIELAPFTVNTTVFSAGQALHTTEQEMELPDHDLARARLAVEAHHSSILRRLRTGEIL